MTHSHARRHRNHTLHVETRDNETGIWLCLDDGFESIPIAKFVSERAVEQYNHAVAITFVKSHAMGRFGL